MRRAQATSSSSTSFRPEDVVHDTETRSPTSEDSGLGAGFPVGGTKWSPAKRSEVPSHLSRDARVCASEVSREAQELSKPSGGVRFDDRCRMHCGRDRSWRRRHRRCVGLAERWSVGHRCERRRNVGNRTRWRADGRSEHGWSEHGRSEHGRKHFGFVRTGGLVARWCVGRFGRSDVRHGRNARRIGRHDRGHGRKLGR
jgi:hypothetical protein